MSQVVGRSGSRRAKWSVGQVVGGCVVVDISRFILN